MVTIAALEADIATIAAVPERAMVVGLGSVLVRVAATGKLRAAVAAVAVLALSGDQSTVSAQNQVRKITSRVAAVTTSSC